MIKILPNEKGELNILKPFVINILFFADDGFLYEIRTKQFDEEFNAHKLTKYVYDCNTWSRATEQSFKELKEIYYKKDKTEL
jgi:hypothetical protein